MDLRLVQCLRCRDLRPVFVRRSRRLDTGECDRCGYLGWAPALAVTRVEPPPGADATPPRRRRHLHAV